MLALGLEISEAQVAAFATFEHALYEANEVMNLTRIPREESWLRHLIDSLLFQDLIPEGSNVLDIGTGPGFPSWPLANARPDLQVTAIDSSGKMLGFLKTQPLPNLTVIQTRAEEWDQREKFDVVTGRAVAPLPVQMEISAPFLKMGGSFIPMRTPMDNFREPDWESVGLRPGGMHMRMLPGTDVERVFPVYVKEHSTHRRFPRRWAEMKAKPLVRR